MKKLKIIISLLILGLVGSLFFIQKTLSRQNEFPFSGEYTQNELLVKFKDESSAKTTLLNIDNEDKKINSKSLYKIKTQENQSITNLYQSLKNNPTVDYIEPNYIVKTTATPNDTNYASQWNLPKISAPSGWDKSQGSSSVVVGVIDTGIDYSHEDLSSKIWNNPGETGSGKETNGLDDDGNGYIDDFRGWDFVTCDLWNSVSPFQCLTPRSQDNNATDDEKHGTSVTGIIGASTNNSLGVAGIGWNVKVVPLKVLNGDGDGTTAEVVAALDYARIKGIPIVNMSLGSTSGSVSLENAVVASYNSGVTMIAATGNDYSSSILYPAKYPQVLAVGATDQSDVRASFSNYGPEIDVVAPGVSIWSTDRMGAVGYSTSNYTAGFAGTSAATPHVAGLASLIKSKYSNYTNAQIISVIKSSTDKVSGMSGQDFTNEYGFGRININKALSSSYSWELVSWNANKSLIGLSPGDTAHITVTAKNTGTTTWLKSTSPAVLLGTNNSKDRSSIFAANGWVNSGRPARLNEDSVLPGSQGVFEFDISVPAKPGTYNEAFSLVAEGITWFNEQNLVIPIKVNGNYSWQFKSQSASKNLVGLSPGEAVTLNLVATNTGDTTWNNSGLGFIALGTTYSRDRLSPFYTQSSWINQARPTKLVEASVPPGQDGTFSWTISVPYGSTVYRENVSLVAEGVTWLNDPGLNYYITVNKIYGWQFVSQSADKNLNGLAVGETAQVTLTARNVGNTTWFRTGKYPFMVGTTYPNDRLSAFNDVSWPNGGRPAALPVDKTFVLPGETVTFSWTIKSPQTVGIYRESVSLVLDGLGWLNDPGLNYYIVVGWADVLEGIPMPATSGLTAREQHLSLSGCAEIPSTHYSISGTLVGDQNGMAWQTSGGCGYGAWGVAPPAADEKYYINMRWNYTSQNGQPIYTNKAWYYRKKIIVINPANGKKLVASVVEYGPGIMSRVSGLSPEAMTALGAVTNSNLEYHWYLNQAAVPGPLN